MANAPESQILNLDVQAVTLETAITCDRVAGHSVLPPTRRKGSGVPVPDTDFISGHTFAVTRAAVPCKWVQLFIKQLNQHCMHTHTCALAGSQTKRTSRRLVWIPAIYMSVPSVFPGGNSRHRGEFPSGLNLLNENVFAVTKYGMCVF